VAFEPFDVVTLPFPFADRNESVVRPAVVLTSHAAFGQHSGIAIVAMITSAKRSKWPFDVGIADLPSAGLRAPCLVRGKLNAIDLTLIDRKIGSLSPDDRHAIAAALRGLLAGVLAGELE
jgi:mRNA interferase MazF